MADELLWISAETLLKNWYQDCRTLITVLARPELRPVKLAARPRLAKSNMQLKESLGRSAQLLENVADNTDKIVVRYKLRPDRPKPLSHLNGRELLQRTTQWQAYSCALLKGMLLLGLKQIPGSPPTHGAPGRRTANQLCADISSLLESVAVDAVTFVKNHGEEPVPVPNPMAPPPEATSMSKLELAAHRLSLSYTQIAHDLVRQYQAK
jgi:hypothetical protein